jgi:pimeloyl-ACP methyl ester carboxylesterase
MALRFPAIRLACLFLAAGIAGGPAGAQDAPAPVDLAVPIPSLALKDGRVLHNVVIVGVGSSTVMARWDGGRGTIGLDVLPEDVRSAAELKRPAAPTPTPAPQESPAQGDGAAPVGRGSALTAARRGFSTHLVRQETMGAPPDQPPPGGMELVSYVGPLGPMAAYVSPPPGDGRRHPAIVWIVGGRSNSISSIAWTPGPPENDQSGSGFREFGIVMMYPSLRGGNQSPGFRERFYGEVYDVMAAARFLAGLSYVDPRRIYLGGHSTGGTLALLVAESSDQFRAVYALGAVGDMHGYGQDDVPFDLSNPMEARLRSPKLWLDSIHVPTFVFEGTDPASSNIWALRDMAAANHNPLVQFREIKGGTHFTIVAPVVRQIAEQIQKDDGK